MSEFSLLDHMARTHFPAEPAWQARRALIDLLDDLDHETLRTLRVQRHQAPNAPDAPALEQGTPGALIEDDVHTNPGVTAVDVQQAFPHAHPGNITDVLTDFRASGRVRVIQKHLYPWPRRLTPTP